MKKRLFAVLLALVMVLALLPTAALAAEKVEIKWLPGWMEPLGYIEESDRILARNGQAWYLLTTSGTIDKVLGNLGSTIDISGYYGSMTFASGMQSVVVDGKGAFIDGTGKVVLQTEYEDVYNFSEGMAQVTSGGLYGFIDETGKTVVPLGYNEAKEFSEGLAAVRIGDWDTGKCGFIDKTGKIVIPFEYEYAESFSEGLALVIKDGKSSFIDKTGKTVIAFQNEICESFSDGRACVYSSDSETANYIDKTGKVVFSVPGCEVVRSFSEGLVQVVSLDYGTRFMDVNGNTVFTLPKGIVCQYFNFTDGVMPVFSDDGAGLIDKTGAYVINLSKDYAIVNPMGPCLVIEKKDGSYGICKNPGYTASQPEQPTVPATTKADPTNDKLSVDGKDATPAAYKIDNANYFKLRDVAMLVNGTKAQFSIDYDGEKKAIMITTGQPYRPQGGELGTVPTAAATAMTSNDAVYINGVKTDLTAYKIDNANYYGIRALAKALGFNVDWTSERGMFIETDKPYSGA